MHIIYLAGGSVRNREWIEKVKENFDSFSTDEIVYYNHWQTGGKNLDFAIDEYLESLSIPVTSIQNEFDPLFSYADLEKTLKQNNVQNYELLKDPSINTHDYEDFENLTETAKGFY